ncbi:zinc dependent phospholipase C family protein [Archangium primigenium]|uniref:zinc dependent phospholipase C family protein n=1 Tax=[Archangium] primigenium TaxID=2792470 RepID=UPI001958F747|nr:zinc dependent phospholipase C family protein [Archangium primigenium]MBM7116995.1 hypothetical protein [Archangium primigenium]
MFDYHLRSRFFVLLSCYLVLLLPAAAWAWKPITHVYLAEEAREDLIKRAGLLQLNEVDFAGASILRSLGTFQASPGNYEALRDHPAEYRAGVLGPDAYPDLIFGQQTIHPDTNDEKLNGTRAWLELLASEVQSPAERSFYLGFLAHAAGDMFGHTFVNHYSGGPFTLLPLNNATRHIAVEGYVGNHTPPLRGPGSYVIDTARVNDFIYRTMIDARRPRDGQLNNKTLPKDQRRQIQIWQMTASTYYKSLPGIFSRLRAGLEDKVSAYYTHKRWLQDQVEDRKARCISAQLIACMEVAYYRTALLNHQISGIGIDYIEAWTLDIDRGLRAWPATSTEVARVLFMKSDRSMDLSAAREVLRGYQRRYLCSMIGSPDIACTLGSTFTSVIEEITGALGLDFIKKLKDAILDHLVKSATGHTPDEWKEVFKATATDVDRQLPAAPSTSSQLNGLMGLKGSPMLFDVDRFAPAYNTRAAIQFSFLDNKTWKPVLGAVGWAHPEPDIQLARYLPQGQFLLGYIGSLDDSNQWIVSSQQRMFLTRDCGLFSRFFMRQKGDLWDEPKQTAMEAECGEVARLRAQDVQNACGNVELEVTLSQPAGDLGALVRLDGVPGVGHPRATKPWHVWLPKDVSQTKLRFPLEPGASPQLSGVRALQSMPLAVAQTGACEECSGGACGPPPCATGFALNAANQCVPVSPLECGADEVMVGVYGKSFAWVDSLGIQCARRQEDMAVGPVRDVGPLGGTGGEPFSLSCNPGEVLYRVSASNGWSTSTPNASWCSATGLSKLRIWCREPGTGVVRERGQLEGKDVQCAQPLSPEFALQCAAGQSLHGLMVSSVNTGTYVGHLLDRTCR